MSNPLLPCIRCKFLFCRCDGYEIPKVLPKKQKIEKLKPKKAKPKPKPPPKIRIRVDGLTIAEFNEWYKSLKAIPCADCGREYPYYVTHWHHLDPQTKMGNPSTLKATRSKQVILDEIAKCILLCANCHAEREYGPKGA